MKFIHAADIHLDSPLVGLERYEGAPVEEIRGATRQALDNMVKLAIDEAVSFVLIAGDLYDGDWKDYNTGLYLSQKMSVLREAGIPVYIVKGNHDAASLLTKQLMMPENVKILFEKKPQTIFNEELNVVIHGQGYAKRDVTDNIAKTYPDTVSGYLNIGLLHTSLNGREGHEPYAPCSLDDLKSKGYDYWALGHPHTYEVVDDGPWVVFSGNTQGRSVRETGVKGCALVTVEDGRVATVCHKELDVVRWLVLDLDVTGTDTGGEVIERVREALEEQTKVDPDRLLAARVRIGGSCKAHSEISRSWEQWINEVRAAATDVSAGRIWVEKVVIKTENRARIEELLCADDALSGLIKSVMELSTDDELLEVILSDFEDVMQKLPPEITEGDEPVDLGSRETYTDAIEDVKQLIIDRILSGGVRVEDN